MILWLVKRIQGVKSTTCDFMLTLIPTQSVRMMRSFAHPTALSSQLRAGLKPGLLGGKHTFVITFCFSCVLKHQTLSFLPVWPLKKTIRTRGQNLSACKFCKQKQKVHTKIRKWFDGAYKFCWILLLKVGWNILFLDNTHFNLLLIILFWSNVIVLRISIFYHMYVLTIDFFSNWKPLTKILKYAIVHN